MLRRLDVPFEIKSVDEKGRFSGYGSTFGDIDHYNDIVVKGAFKDTLQQWESKGRLPALLWQHNHDEPIGVYTEMREGTKGLEVEGQLALKTIEGARAYELLQMKALGGLSIGFRTKEEEYDHDTGIRKLKAVDLWEVSLVTFPANEAAQINAVKDALRMGDVPAQRDVEKILREVGFSRQQAKRLMGGGYRALSQRDAGDGEADSEVKNLLDEINSLVTKFRS